MSSTKTRLDNFVQSRAEVIRVLGLELIEITLMVSRGSAFNPSVGGTTLVVRDSEECPLMEATDDSTTMGVAFHLAEAFGYTNIDVKSAPDGTWRIICRKTDSPCEWWDDSYLPMVDASDLYEVALYDVS
jgi:hypothetical protein